MFHRLAVFSGGRTMAMAEQVCAFGGIEKSKVLDLLARLVNKSLLFAEETNGETRYGFLDTIKQYAREKLEQSGEADLARDRHLNFFVELAEQAAPELVGPHQLEWLNRLEGEHSNLRTALWHAVHKNRNEQALRLSTALTDFWSVRGYLAEGRDWLKQALDSSRATFESTNSHDFQIEYAWALVDAGDLAARLGDFPSVSTNTQAGLELFQKLDDKEGITTTLIILASLARMQSNWSQAHQYLDESILLARELNNRRLLALALRNLAIVDEAQGDYASAQSTLEEALRLAKQQGDPHAISTTLSNLGNIAQQQGDYAEARRMYDEILAMERAMGARWNVAATLTNMGNLAHSEGNYVAAQDYHEQALKIMREVGDKRGNAIVLTNLGNALLSQGDFETARKLHEATLGLRRELGDKRGVAITLGNLGDVAIGFENYAEAQNLYAEALMQLLAVGDKRTIINCLIGAAQAAVGLGAFERAAKLAGAIDVLRATLDAEIDIRERAFHEHVTRQAQAHMDESTFNTAWTEGEQLSMEQAIALVTQSVN